MRWYKKTETRTCKCVRTKQQPWNPVSRNEFIKLKPSAREYVRQGACKIALEWHWIEGWTASTVNELSLQTKEYD